MGDKQEFIFHISKTRTFKIKVPADSKSGEDPLPDL